MLLARILLAALLVIGFGSGAQTRSSTNAPSAPDNCIAQFRLVNESNAAITELY